MVHRLKAEFPQFTIAINGGITTDDVVQEQLQHLDGVMIGREAYHNPGGWRAGTSFTTAAPLPLTREEVELAMVEYMEREAAQHGTPGPTSPATCWPAPQPARRPHLAPGVEQPSAQDRPAREVHALAMQACSSAAPEQQQSRARWQQQLPNQPPHPGRQRLRPTEQVALQALSHWLSTRKSAWRVSPPPRPPRAG